ncbi:MAG: Spx/MgsR family RNA polymerase-binding regulatory protein [Ferruginibacter sp.]
MKQFISPIEHPSYMLHLYGIPNCDSVKKAVQFLHRNKIPFRFHNFKEEGLSKQKIAAWCVAVPVEKILNKKSTAWKLLSAVELEKAGTLPGAIALMSKYTNLVKRPVAEKPGIILTGFNETDYSKHFQHG